VAARYFFRDWSGMMFSSLLVFRNKEVWTVFAIIIIVVAAAFVAEKDGMVLDTFKLVLALVLLVVKMGCDCVSKIYS
jgi:hypothetical protein